MFFFLAFKREKGLARPTFLTNVLKVVKFSTIVHHDICLERFTKRQLKYVF